jgi:hypothetical protein
MLLLLRCLICCSLSTFVDNEAEGYTPEFALKIKQLQVRGCTVIMTVNLPLL